MNNINFIYQHDGCNCLEVIYKSGARRWVMLGDSVYMYNKNQWEFINEAERFEFGNCRYWAKQDSTVYNKLKYYSA